MTRIFFVVLTVQLWDNLEIHATNYPLPVSNCQHGPAGMAGYLPVYETREDAEREWPNAQISECREVTP